MRFSKIIEKLIAKENERYNIEMLEKYKYSQKECEKLKSAFSQKLPEELEQEFFILCVFLETKQKEAEKIFYDYAYKKGWDDRGEADGKSAK